MTNPEGRTTGSHKALVASLVIAVLALGAAAVWFVHSKGSFSHAGSVQAKTLTAWDRGLGDPKAPVVVIEYASPQCHHCARFDMEFFPLLKKKYIDTGKVYFVLRIFPLSAADSAAAAIARCLPQDKYFSFFDLLWRNQATWDPVDNVPDVHAGLVTMARKEGMSAERVDSCIGNQGLLQRISKIGDEGTRKYGIMNVPTFVINGRPRRFTDDWDAFQNDIDDVVSKNS